MTLKQAQETLTSVARDIDFKASIDMQPDYLDFEVVLPSGQQQKFVATTDTVAGARPYELLWDLADAMVNFSQGDDHLWYADEATNPKIFAESDSGISQADADWLNTLGEKVRQAANKN
ncbi:hypothetical protein [Lacticaseibacillus brantae]|uniref:Uncharacterized protein n=1 Tax=Lacticaseibacillus brantae DSM 23927 TaxID=1423727 RepID=A0A0R2BB99_9LACO|nr:hypothetical protein [Lacticaseibacillus brantae]KRM72915.1 hypothetical protein FC34_GL000627 [Lacticaseibacillus brantae DSM 23927]